MRFAKDRKNVRIKNYCITLLNGRKLQEIEIRKEKSRI
jgi:uncharacterized protein (UPF0179 family)